MRVGGVKEWLSLELISKREKKGKEDGISFLFIFLKIKKQKKNKKNKIKNQ